MMIFKVLMPTTNQKVKIVVFVPESHANQVRMTMGEVGAGQIGNYSFCSFTTKGIGRFLPGKDTNPTIGAAGQPTEIIEERIEMVCDREILPTVIEAMRKVHPYEEVAFDIYALENF